MRMMMTTNSKRTMQMPVKHMQMLKRPRIYRKIMRRDRKR